MARVFVMIVPPPSHAVEPPVYCLLTNSVEVDFSHMPFSSPKKVADAFITSSPDCVLFSS